MRSARLRIEAQAVPRRDGGEARADAAAPAQSAERSKLGAHVSIRGLAKRYGGAIAVDGISLDIAAGEFMTLLGPSGSGKTTTMMAVAGFVEGYEGEIRIGDRIIDALPPHRRNVGVLFQHLALFPHMNVADNIAFPLRMRGMSEREVAPRVRRAVELVKMSGFERRLPAQMSGGQQQRVALARAIVFDPPVLLLDEPLGALDRKLRESMQAELKALHKRLGTTIIHVTHDQEEAMAISDRIAVINRGRVEQCGTPRELYSRPVNRFVADFVGDSVFLDAVVEDPGGTLCRVRLGDGLSCLVRAGAPLAEGARITLMVRPELFRLGADAAASENRFTGTVGAASFNGDRVRYEIALSRRNSLTVVVANRGEMAAIPPGRSIEIGWNTDDAVVFAAEDPREDSEGTA